MNNDFENQNNENNVTNVNPESPMQQSVNASNQAQRVPQKPAEAYGYRWNYNEYRSEAAKETKKVKKNGFKIFAVTIASVFVLSFAVLTTALTVNLLNGTASEVKPDEAAESVTEKAEKPTSGVPAVNGNETKQTVSFPSASDLATKDNSLTIPQIAEKCLPSAVGVVVEVETSYGFGFGSYTSKGVGSGFVISADGYIVTNHHVIENAKKITVVLNDETEVDATLVGSDSLSDLAVLKIEHEGLVPMEIGNSDELVVGELAVAIGSPAGIEFYGTVTDGIISAIKRNVEITDNYGRVQKTMTLIQTNATINRGNSGGPLINSRGQVVGINTLKLASEYEGIGFSIPINGAMTVINQLMKDGKVSERSEDDFVSGGAAIGITEYADIAEDEAEYYGIPQGVYVIQIKRDSNAAQAGLRRGDIITKYNGEEVKTAAEINEKKNKNRVGDQVTITVYRDQEGEKEITFKLDSQE